MDKMVNKVAALGIPGLIFVTAIGAYNISAKNKRKKCTGTVRRSIDKAATADVLCESAHEASGQADAIFVDVINAARIDHLLKAIAKIDRNNAGTDKEVQLLKAEVDKIITSNRGGIKGIHGFIGETSQVHVANINAFINGEEPLYILQDDNSMTDYIRGFEIIQQKACQAGGHLGLDAIKRHKVKYPEFVEHGGIYQIPKDLFDKYIYLKNMPEEVAAKLKQGDLRLWKYIRKFAEENPDVTVEPMEISYSDIQAGNIGNTIKRIEEKTQSEFEKKRKLAYEEHAPTIEEFLKVCGISAAIEGGISAGTEFVQKIKSGKKLSEFTKQDFRDIGAKVALGSSKGAVRGGIVYIVTNSCKISAAVTSGIVTALFEICREGYLLFKKKITKERFTKNLFSVILKTVASTGSASIGKCLWKKHPVIGALFGSILGSTSADWLVRTAFA